MIGNLWRLLFPKSRIVSVYNGNYGKVYDADGKEVGNLIEANLDTGECEVLKLDKDGKPYVDFGFEELARERVTRPAPLTFKPEGF